MNVQTFKASKGFPVYQNEVISVRDGRGNVVERWVVRNVYYGDRDTLFTAELHGYKSVASV